MRFRLRTERISMCCRVSVLKSRGCVTGLWWIQRDSADKSTPPPPSPPPPPLSNAIDVTHKSICAGKEFLCDFTSFALKQTASSWHINPHKAFILLKACCACFHSFYLSVHLSPGGLLSAVCGERSPEPACMLLFVSALSLTLHSVQFNKVWRCQEP